MKKILLLSTLFASGMSMAQLPVSTTAENKNVVLEEYTGIYCTYCPDGHKKAQEYKDLNPNDVFLVNVHTGGYANPSGSDPDFRTPFGADLATLSDLTGYPAGSINRRIFPSYSMASGSAMSRGDWVTAGNVILSESAYVNVAGEATLDVQTRELTVTVEYYYTGNSPVSTNKLNIALLQNNVEGPQTGASDFYPSNILPNGNYNHQHMLRHFLTGQWGVDITTTTSGSTAQVVETYTIPADLNGVEYNLGNLEIVAYIAEGQEEIVNAGAVPITLTNFPYQVDAEVTSAEDVPGLCSGTANLDPVITVKNNGEQDITSLVIDATLNNGTVVSTNWSGSISYGQSEYITLNTVSGTVQANNDLDIEITTVNGSTTLDEVASNDLLTKSFVEAPTGGNIVVITVKTDYYPNETEWELQDDMGTVIESDTYQAGTDDQWGGGGADANATFTYTVNLGAPGCYKLVVTDVYGDGMIFDAGGSSTSSNYGIEVTNHDGSVILVDIVGSTFEDSAFESFQSDGTSDGSGIEENVLSNVSVYPNPTDGLANVDFTIEEQKNVKINIINTLGQTVISEDLGEVSGAQHYTINGAALEAGVYVINMNIDGEQKNYRLTVK
ncbi:MAG: Omp28-related outer membrane protein [Crocinitomicaceae bacterium]